ncbi:MAG: adenine phosphoribosyltransferase [Acidobacteriota bacterium]|jgi:adenine phosphoribosyltransferase|nr:adenine phosphoribosyltransferase [Acidobacteriota bacterium]
MEHLKKLIREVPDFPKEGINFYDITTLLQDADGFKQTIDALVEQVKDEKIDTVIGIESRGFIFGTPVAYQLGAGFIPVRKPNKLPWEKVSVSYDLEYGQDTLEMHRDAVGDGHNVLIVDDLLATGGTARAVADLVKKVGGNIVKMLFVIELDFLGGRDKLNGYEINSLLNYDS